MHNGVAVAESAALHVLAAQPHMVPCTQHACFALQLVHTARPRSTAGVCWDGEGFVGHPWIANNARASRDHGAAADHGHQTCSRTSCSTSCTSFRSQGQSCPKLLMHAQASHQELDSVLPTPQVAYAPEL